MKKFLLGISGLLWAVAGSAQWTTDALNSPAASLNSASTTGRAVFTNGSEWDVFDVYTGMHDFGALAQSRNHIQTVQYGDRVFFGGGKYGSFADPQYSNVVDVYDGGSHSWTSMVLSNKREVGGAGAAGNRIFFAGGIGRTDISGPVYVYKTVDIFNAVTGARVVSQLSKARTNLAVGTAGSKILFAGGWFWDFAYNQQESNQVDIYDVSAGLWSTATLSKKRDDISVATVGNKVIFAGGYNSNSGSAKNVDIYDATTNTWTTTSLLAANYGMINTVLGNKVYFAGGAINGNRVQVYDVAADSWSWFALPVNIHDFTMDAIHGKIYFAGGYRDATATYLGYCLVYDPDLGTWNGQLLSEARIVAGVAVVDDAVGVFAGGITGYTFSTPITTQTVDLYTVPVLRTDAPPMVLLQEQPADVNVMPNPTLGNTTIVLSDRLQYPVRMTIYSLSGMEMNSMTVMDPVTQSDLNFLPTGTYLLVGLDAEGKTFRSNFEKN